MKFKNLSIKYKILSGSMALVLITLIFGLLAYSYIGKVSGTLFGITICEPSSWNDFKSASG